MRTRKVVEAYNILKGAKLVKLSKEEMFDVISGMIEMRPIVEKFNKDAEEAEDKMKGAKHDELVGKATKHNNAVQANSKKELLSVEDLTEVNKYFQEYHKKVNDFREGLGEKEVTLSIKKINEDVIFKLIEHNEDLTIEQVMIIKEVIGG